MRTTKYMVALNNLLMSSFKRFYFLPSVSLTVDKGGYKVDKHMFYTIYVEWLCFQLYFNISSWEQGDKLEEINNVK